MIVGWEDRLIEYVERKRNVAFRWGSNDCVLFSLKGIDYIFKTNTVSRLPKWKTKTEGAKVIASFGKDLAEAADAKLPELGFEKVPLGFAGRGDIVIQEGPLGPMFCLCVGGKVVAPGKNGIEFLPIEGVCWKFRGN